MHVLHCAVCICLRIRLRPAGIIPFAFAFLFGLGVRPLSLLLCATNHTLLELVAFLFRDLWVIYIRLFLASKNLFHFLHHLANQYILFFFVTFAFA